MKVKFSKNQSGVAAAAIIVLLVVIAAVVVVALVVKNKNKTSDTTKTTTSTTTAPKAPTKSVSGVTFAASLTAAGAPTAFTSDELTAITNSQTQNGSSRFFTAQGGYLIGVGTDSSAIQWGPTVKSANSVNLKQYLENSAKQNASDATVNVAAAPAQNLTASDGAKYKANCYTFIEAVSGRNYYGSACLADVQKSSVYVFAQSTTSAATASANLSKLVAGSTLTLQ